MSESDAPSVASGRSDEERAAFFEELMREERERQPVNGFAIAAFVSGLLGGLLAPVFAIVARVQMRERQQRGMPLVVVGLLAFAVWVVVDVTWWVNRDTQPDMIAGYELKVGECFQAPGASGQNDVVRASCTEWHTGQAFAEFSLPDGAYPGIVELYDASLARCQDLAGSASLPDDGEVQVMTLTPDTWAKRKHHRIVCYVRFAHQVDHAL